MSGRVTKKEERPLS